MDSTEGGQKAIFQGSRLFNTEDPSIISIFRANTICLPVLQLPAEWAYHIV
jgi:hypothetical protein